MLQSLGLPRVRHDSATEQLNELSSATQQLNPQSLFRCHQLYKHSLVSAYTCNFYAVWIICVAQHIQDPEIICHHRAPNPLPLPSHIQSI